MLLHFFLALLGLPLMGTTLTQLIIDQREGHYGKISSFSFNRTTEFVLVFPTSSSLYPYRISAWTTVAAVQNPVMVVVRQEREVLSWQVPFLVESNPRHQKLMEFSNTSRTLCHNDMGRITKAKSFSRNRVLNIAQNFIVALSTSSKNNVDIFVKVEEERNFYLDNDVRYEFAVSPSEPKYYYYKFPNNRTSMVTLEITSEDDVCLTVSIQDSYCPVFDLEKDITYEGKYQTINRKGGMSIRQRDYPDGFFVVIVAKSDNYDCSQEHSALPNPRNTVLVAENRTSIVSFMIRKGIDGKGYGVASLITLGAIVGFYIVCIIMNFTFTRWGTISKIVKLRKQDAIDGTTDTEEYVIVAPLTKDVRLDLLMKKNLTVNQLSRDLNTNTKRSYNYLWHILSIAIFYSIPVVQLVFTYQRVVNRTGDQDMCYYNFLCANPAFGLSDFNHIFSNIGYILIGILFCCVVLHRSNILPSNSFGTPVNYGVFYAMGVALIIEGVLSACYHFCPTQSNYQFDTSFMYVMAVLCMIKIYQNRHTDINATSYATFTVLGVAIFLAMIGILNGSLAVWIVFVVVYSFLCWYISFKIYFFSFVIDGFLQLKKSVQETGFKSKHFAPIRRSHFVVLLLANIINLAMLIGGIFMFSSGYTDFGTFLLGLLMANAIVYASFYTVMKLVHGEKICAEAIIYGLLGVASWVVATIYFLDNATLWTVTAAESRQWNQECVLMNFYDKHDVWHLLSAPALFFTFMFLLCLDDDLVDKKRTEIIVF